MEDPFPGKALLSNRRVLHNTTFPIEAPLTRFKMNVFVTCFDGNLGELGAFLQTLEKCMFQVNPGA
jgi:hypothetical protein